MQKIRLLNLINEQVFAMGTAIKFKKNKNDVVITTYKQISVKRTP